VSRLALVGPVHPLRGGIAQHTAGIALEARRRGHDVRVFSYRRLYPKILFPGRTQLDPGAAPMGVPREVVSESIDSIAPRSWLETAREVAACRPNAVFLQRWHPFFAPPLALVARRARRDRIPIVWLVHNARPHEGAGWPWGPLLTLGFDPRDTCIVHAEGERATLAALGVDSPVRLLPMPTPSRVARIERAEARRRFGLADDVVVFLFVGHVRRYKGVDVLLEALARLPAEGRAWCAIIAGEWYVDREPAIERARLPPLAGRVRIDDRFLPEHDLSAYLSAADAVVLPYRAGTQSAVVPLAYAHGRPVVTTRVGGIAEALREGETGLLVPPEDPAALAAALDRVRRGHPFSAAAIAEAHARASFEPFLDLFEELRRSARPDAET